MATTLFTEQENGNLKLVAEVEGIDNPALAVDALLDDAPRLKEREFVAIIGSIEDGTVTRVVVDNDEPVNPRRSITVSVTSQEVADEAGPEVKAKPQRQQRRASSAKRSASRKAAPAKRSAKKQSRKAAPAKKSAAKKAVTGARKSAAKKTAVRSSAKKSGGRKSSPFKTRPDDE